MGFGACEGFFRKLNKVVKKEIEKELGTTLNNWLPKGLRWSEFAMWYADRNDLDTYKSDCNRANWLHIEMELQSSKKIDKWIEFKCACQKKTNQEKIEYNGLNIWVNKTVRGTRHYKQPYFKIVIEKPNTANYAVIEGYDKEILINYIKKEIDDKKLIDVYGNQILV